MSGAITRRDLLTAAVVGFGGGLLDMRSAQATPEAVAKAVEKILGGKTPKIGRITFDMSDIAADGANVLMGLRVDRPMTETDYVEAVHVFAEQNPNPRIISFYFTPLSGKAEIITRIRLAKNQKIIAFAKMSDGTFYSAEKFIKVTIGGCGGTN